MGAKSFAGGRPRRNGSMPNLRCLLAQRRLPDLSEAVPPVTGLASDLGNAHSADDEAASRDRRSRRRCRRASTPPWFAGCQLDRRPRGSRPASVRPCGPGRWPGRPAASPRSAAFVAATSRAPACPTPPRCPPLRPLRPSWCHDQAPHQEGREASRRTETTTSRARPRGVGRRFGRRARDPYDDDGDAVIGVGLRAGTMEQPR